MSAPRLHVAAPLATDDRVSLSTEQTHYLINVLRCGAGAELRVFNANDGEFAAVLEPNGKRSAVAALHQKVRAPTPSPDLHLLFAPLKKTRTDFVVEKASELGVSAVRPVFTRRTNAERVNTDRLSAIACEAAEQCERLDVPDVRAPEPLEAVLAGWSRTDLGRRLLFCDEGGVGASSSWSQAGEAAPVALAALFSAPEIERAPWAVLVGPEGGFTPEERALIRAHPAVTVATLGPRVLRADTAALAALTLWQSVLGDWR